VRFKDRTIILPIKVSLFTWRRYIEIPEKSVGRVERSKTHQASQDDNATEAMGFTSFYPSYAL
jgi:hypothetical protein